MPNLSKLFPLLFSIILNKNKVLYTELFKMFIINFSYILNLSFFQPFCGGTLINSKFVLTGKIQIYYHITIGLYFDVKCKGHYGGVIIDYIAFRLKLLDTPISQKDLTLLKSVYDFFVHEAKINIVQCIHIYLSIYLQSVNILLVPPKW